MLETAQFVEIDLLQREALASQLRAFHCDAVIHMAAHSLVRESMTDPAKYYRNNVLSGLSLLDAMRAAMWIGWYSPQRRRIYGEPAEQPVDETDSHHPTNTYGETKLAFERALHWYGQAHGLSSISLRYFNAAGATSRCGERHDPETHRIPLVLQAAAGVCQTSLSLEWTSHARRDVRRAVRRTLFKHL